MGNVGIALGGGKAFSAPAWFILVIIGLAVIGINHVIQRTKN
ncbi:hypothetical protein SAMN02799630_03409 [Paenibacillus sp. UNCCL117]|nr:hypothetical protein SAMN04488602_108210 [Paenibacillus sp. cl123]SFW47017.1 hypothetical protein SAMN02799630_03409 [Paenibacillus sp. UNCCL117]